VTSAPAACCALCSCAVTMCGTSGPAGRPALRHRRPGAVRVRSLRRPNPPPGAVPAPIHGLVAGRERPRPGSRTTLSKTRSGESIQPAP
jgi:hypothetical protein